MRICIIHTGGTIGMTKSNRGYTTQKGLLGATLQGIAQLHTAQMPSYELIELPVILDSSDVTLAQWNEIGLVIADNYNAFDGFVVLHGTDTMCYTASALSFMLQGLDKPVVLTGAQIPFSVANSDAEGNVCDAVRVAANCGIREVCVCFGGKVLRGNRATKLSADRMVAFDSPNVAPIAEFVDGNLQLNNSIVEVKANKPFSFTPFKPFSIAVIKAFPGIQFGIFENILKPDLKGIVLEAFGAGNVPQHGDLLELLAKAQRNGTAIVIVSQCLQGTVRLGLYLASSALAEQGAICGFDMTPECAVTKLYYLLTLNKQGDQLKQLMESNLCGEITIG